MSAPAAIRLYGFPLSGHSHRVQLFLSLLQLPYEFLPVDLSKGEQKQADFLRLNPRGQVPVIIDGDVTLYDSTAILVYLARRYAPQWLPDDALTAAQVQQFLSLASGEILEGPARARMVVLFKAPFDHAYAKTKADHVLRLLDQHLQTREFLVGTQASIADIACYSYVAHAPEGDVSLDQFAHLQRWIARIQDLPHFLAMPAARDVMHA